MSTTLVAEPEHELLLCGGRLQVDVRAQVARLHERPLQLTPKEFALLTLLVRHADRAFSRADLLSRVWAYPHNAVETRTVDTHVLRLRKKLGAVGEHIETVWGIGYRFASGPPEHGAPASKALAQADSLPKRRERFRPFRRKPPSQSEARRGYDGVD